MYPRFLTIDNKKSFFLFGPRGTGKSSWVRQNIRPAIYLDLLESETYTSLLASPQRMEQSIPPGYQDWIIIDEVQRVPEILNEVHRLIENRGLRFALTGSSARKLRRRSSNLLAGRALSYSLFPLTAAETQQDFTLKRALQFGNLPAVFQEANPKAYLQSYVATYLREEVQQEGLTRNLAAFTRFLEAASFSQGSVLNISNIASDCSVERKIVEDYFTILEDLMIGLRLPVFTRKAKRKMTAHPKFYFFDAGLYRTLRPRGPLDPEDEMEGPALETLVLNEIRALNSYLDLGYQLFYWRSASKQEVDFVLYGEKGLKAIEVKRASRIRPGDLDGLQLFLEDYPMTEARMIYCGEKRFRDGSIEIIPVQEVLTEMSTWLGKS